ncbi:hypothetical protein Sme01_64540 [Sphaerisporangium melleum]|uniref:WXG100 family type VII secretion target n=1 Tax=Sphaerisporangium melleum TaxID=321316 RepID=A0A917RFL9_9ACTN|nr:hypothetical protein [Sphaerisporangium melleum]GGL04108.1 hypothetical protein GCM10007964_52770 [Sphaerisporangium melleum]GII73978.1 hypothetical protein Sme01_64540 [Sphaerisporangium melleum]
MPRILLDFEAIEATSARLDSTRDSIVPMLEDLRGRVDGLLQEALVFPQSSPAMTESYNKFNTGLLSAMEGITAFAKQFRDIVNQMREMDGEMANSIRESG